MLIPSIGLIALFLLIAFGVVFLLWVLYHLREESRPRRRHRHSEWPTAPQEPEEKRSEKKAAMVACAIVCLYFHSAAAQSTGTVTSDMLQQRLTSLQQQMNELQQEIHELKAKELAASSTPAVAPSTPATEPSASAAAPAEISTQAIAQPAATPLNSLLPLGSTLNLTFDGYYEYNFNHPAGRVNSLRAYDVLSNSFDLNQAAVIFELPTDVEKGRRYGMRLDLQFGQATATLQGNPANENRPDIYRNIFQAYGRYVAPAGKGLTLDFGKWASSLGYEGNYTKDQLNYTRSFFFYYLPFYHMGLHANYPVNDKIAINYWVVNGTDQTEAFNSFKDEMFGLALAPTKNVSWTVNYYLGQEHPDVAPATNCGSAPLQPGLCFKPIQPAPNGKTHYFDSYASWQANPRWLFAAEGDYAIERLWQNAAPGRSSAPSHVIGGVLYAQYQLRPRMSLASRAEYLSDRGGLFSGTTQALKETTGTFTYRLGDGLQTMLEYRRDWSNHNFFPRGLNGETTDHQDTTTLGLVWWYGGKQGSW